MKTIGWESIDDELFEECGFGECIQVKSNEDYLDAMSFQNKSVLDCLRCKYPDREFRVSKWHPHGFGQYQEVEEKVVYQDDEEEE